MKKFIFSKDGCRIGKCEEFMINVPKGITGSTFCIHDSVLEKAYSEGLATSRIEVGKNNIYFRLKNGDFDNTLLRLKENKHILLDSELRSGEWIGKTFSDLNMNINNCATSGKHIPREVAKATLHQVLHYTKEKGEVLDKSYGVNIVHILKFISENPNITSKNDIYNGTYNGKHVLDITKSDGHHNNTPADNRLNSVNVLTSNAHASEGRKSHQAFCVIDNLDKLLAFLKFINSEEYYNSFK